MEHNEKRSCKLSLQSSKFSEDIELEILSWLPLDSLATIKSVSKRWNDLYPIKPFLLRHSRAHANPKFYLFVTHYLCSKEAKDLIYLFSFEYNKGNNARETTMVKKACCVPFPRRGTYSISNICNGLVCLQTDSHDDWPVFLFSLRAQIAIPLRGISAVSPRRGHQVISYCCFLGFNATNQEYKVLRIVTLLINRRNVPRICEYEILNLTSSSNSWESIHNELVPPAIREGGGPTKDSCCIDGVIYWLRDTCDDWGYPNGDFSTLAAYDLKHDRFRVFEIDKLAGLSSMKGIGCNLTTLRGCPTLFLYKPGDNKFRKFTMENHTSSNNVTWSISQTISCPFSVPCNVVRGTIVIKKIQDYGLRFKCYDLEDGTSWDMIIKSEALSDQWFRYDRFSTVFLDEGVPLELNDISFTKTYIGKGSDLRSGVHGQHRRI